ncbi:tryptophan 7-halogenase [Luteimonas sp. 3794]|uniref:tryptophan halogenase family protein n=1 Tax=Luteimonas sp. 3794 TaxID=2817730 RepID=UPI0028553C24|nr:tryptophan 7-halogenase [Luteimonas sp. 3794]MDR6990569.1 tryptophan halogenase [Luteimonas sp. 3794]
MHVASTDQGQAPIRRVVIAGGGTAGWMAAAALSRTLGKVLEITLVESDEIGTIGVGEATIPTLMTFHRLLGIGEQEFMAQTQATIKLGINFENWRDVGQDYFHSFGLTGTDHWTAGFQHFWMRGRERGLASAYDDYCLELKAALDGRFAHLPKRKLNYAYHLDATLYARYLRRFSEANGARRVEGKISDVATDPDSGCITALQLENGTRVEGDFFIDCTGFRALLIEKTLGVGFDDWSHWLFNDRAFAVPTATVRDAVPYTRAIAGPAGWQWRIPLQHRVGNGIVYSSRYMDDDQARDTLLSSIDGAPLRDPFPVRFRPGQRMRCWEKNCVALGLSASFIEPLESTTIHLIQRGIIHLMQTFPRTLCQPDIDQYNMRMADELQHARDFVILHFNITDRQDTPYWRDCKAMPIPDSLRHRIELFRETGRVFHVPTELFAENSWIQVMMGQGIYPREYHRSADLMGDAELKGFLDGIRQDVERTLRQLPPHMEYVRSYAPATPA